MHIVKKLTPVLALAVMLVACETETSDTVDQDKIRAVYTHEYDKNTDVTTAFAQFRFGNGAGTVLELKDPAKVTVTSQAMDYNTTLGLYSKTFAGIQNVLAFAYTDLDNNTFANTINLVKPIGFKTDLDTISKSGAFELFWEGDSLAPNETVLVGIWQNNNPLTQTLILETTVNNKKVILPQNRLAEVNTGTTTIGIRREKKVPVQQGTSEGGELISRYQGQNKQIVIAN